MCPARTVHMWALFGRAGIFRGESSFGGHPAEGRRHLRDSTGDSQDRVCLPLQALFPLRLSTQEDWSEGALVPAADWVQLSVVGGQEGNAAPGFSPPGPLLQAAVTGLQCTPESHHSCPVAMPWGHTLELLLPFALLMPGWPWLLAVRPGSCSTLLVPLDLDHTSIPSPFVKLPWTPHVMGGVVSPMKRYVGVLTPST